METILGVDIGGGADFIPILKFNWVTHRYLWLNDVAAIAPNETKLYVIRGKETGVETIGDVRKYMFDKYKEVF